MKIVALFIHCCNTHPKRGFFFGILLRLRFRDKHVSVSIQIDTVLCVRGAYLETFYRSQTFSAVFDGWAAVGDFHIVCRRCLKVLASRAIWFELSKVFDSIWMLVWKCHLFFSQTLVAKRAIHQQSLQSRRTLHELDLVNGLWNAVFLSFYSDLIYLCQVSLRLALFGCAWTW
jgi:hypothetical protein